MSRDSRGNRHFAPRSALILLSQVPNLRELLRDFGCVVRGAVVDDDDFVGTRACASALPIASPGIPPD